MTELAAVLLLALLLGALVWFVLLPVARRLEEAGDIDMKSTGSDINWEVFSRKVLLGCVALLGGFGVLLVVFYLLLR